MRRADRWAWLVVVALPVAAARGGDEAAGTVLRGTVVDEAGKPAAGVLVEPLGRDFNKGVEAVRTGADGGFTFRAARLSRPLSFAAVRAKADGERLGVGSTPLYGGESARPMRVVLAPSRPLTVRVKDADGKPVAGAAVEVATSEVASGRKIDAVDPGLTDEGGVARFRVPADARAQEVVALKGGVGADCVSDRAYPPGAQAVPVPDDLALTLRRGRTVTLRAVDSAGGPVPGVVFQMNGLVLKGRSAPLGTLRIAEVTTDASGIARWDWVPEECAWSNPVIPPEGFIEESRPEFFFPNAGDLTQNVLFRRKARLTGRVVNADGSPAPGVTLAARGVGKIDSGATGSARSGEDGSYSMEVIPERSYLIAVSDLDRAAEPVSDIPIGEGETHGGLDFRLIDGTRLHGQMAVPLRGRLGVSVFLLGPELPVTLQPRPEAKERLRLAIPVRLDVQGRYEARLGPGDYEVRAVGHAEVPTIHVGGGGEVVQDFLGEPIPEPVALNGVVVEALPGGGERPKEGVFIRVAATSFGSRTDAAGRFAIQRPAGDVAVYASSLDGVAAVKVAKGVDEVKVVLGPSVTASGRVVDPSGRPLAGEQPRLLMLSGPGDLPGLTNTIRLPKFEAGGRYELRGLVPGAEYKLILIHTRDTGAEDVLTIKTFRATAPGPIDLGEFVIPAAQP